MHLIKQLDEIVRNQHLPSPPSRWQVFNERIIPVIVRMFVCTMFFGIFFDGGLPQLLKAFNVEPPTWTATMSVLLANTGIVGWSVSGLIGFALDSIIDYVPVFKSYLPPSIDGSAPVSK